nr:PREDICTED: uncharacterized protein LOC109037708 [Bemisia tabaci]
MSIGTSRGPLLFFSALAALAHVSEALARVSGAQGGLKWGPLREHEHRIYIATRREPCNPAISCSSEDAEWSAVGERPQAQVTGPQLCESLRKSFNQLHVSQHGNCPNPVSAECSGLKCNFVMDTSSQTSLFRSNSKRKKTLSECASTIKAEHEKFMERENDFLKRKNTAKPTYPCTCPHCRNCPLAIYGCPYCPFHPRKVNDGEMERPDEEYAGMREHVGSLNIPALMGRGKSNRYDPPLSMASVISNAATAARPSSRNPNIPPLAYQTPKTPTARPIMSTKGKSIDYSQYYSNQSKSRSNKYASSSKP